MSTAADTLDNQSTSDALAPPVEQVTAATFITQIEHRQQEWDDLNAMGQAIICATVQRYMMIYLFECKTAFEAFDILRSVFGQDLHQSTSAKLSRWIQCTYDPKMKAQDFVDKWRQNMLEVQMAFAPKDRPSASFCYHIFLSAVSANPTGAAWVSALNTNESPLSLCELENAFRDLLAFVPLQEGHK
ncbi:uncharacterized protein N7529_007019 [Penicillium soppii]|jgi:hypothetical protein|uniref:uncharacterized protein n=1 Tax=Penicillium soppii TaxID=69789 RepID=UPI002546CEC3|nr:uncharacterized protein N7529_007019 [Penicillium soppii]KAJ5865103.1 hypothetical protein N7529_007019 [Penicillium soppii]